MPDSTFAPYWPANQPRHLSIPETSLWTNIEVSATRYPDKPCMLFYDSPTSYREFRSQAEKIAGYLQQQCGVQAGDRVLLYMQNSPQFVLAYYGILRANAVVVPVNPMNRTAELEHYLRDTDATTAFASQELFEQIAPLLGLGLQHLVLAAYSDYLLKDTDLPVPAFVAAPRLVPGRPGVTLWSDMLAQACVPGPATAGPDDLCVMPYTSGTTGHPKGCMHTHRSVMYSLVSGMQWFATQQDSVMLSTLPLFHVTGMQGSMNGPLYVGATIVILPRWDRDMAARLAERYRITNLQLIVTMVVDFLSNPELGKYDLSSVRGIRGGGAAMPEAVARKLHEVLGLDYVEGYGMSETMAATHINPPEHPKKQCLGIPLFDVDARIVDPENLQPLAQGETGEIVVHAPNVMRGYWKRPDADREAFFERDGKRFLRTGDLGYVDSENYFFMVDRLKRMINASGFKVWPAEVEALLYRHPAIREACVIAATDEKRGETVKALVVLRDGVPAPTAAALIEWAHENMAAYKCPRIIEFMDALPKTSSGKVQWRELQERETLARKSA
ncbi:MAG: AMP-binding enzyme family protein [Paucimonas sp.]|nr:AMP-binding enzyme family protein [Paucimonas sp.]